MRLKLVSWNGHNINDDTNYTAVISPGNMMPSATANFIDLGQSNPIFSGKTINGGYFTFHILLRGSIEAQRDVLNSWFQLTESEAGVLLAEDLDNSNHKWYLEGYPVTPPMSEKEPAKLSITIALKQPYWIEYDENVTNWNITADTETQVVTNNGNVEALPVFEVTPNDAKGSNTIRGKLYVALSNENWGDIGAYPTFPVDLTPSGWDTAAQILAGDMQSAGNDIAVTVDGVPTYRWLVGINTSATHVWANVPLFIAPSLTLVTVMDNSTLPASLVCSFTAATVTFPQNSTLKIGTEIITYSTVTVDNILKQVTFIPVERGAKGSTKAAHLAGVSVYWVKHEILITYGNPSASAPTQDETQQPAFYHDVSTNSSWVYTDFSKIPLTGRTQVPRFMGAATSFTAEDAAGNGQAEPYEVLGKELASIQQGDKVYVNNVWGRISFVHPGNISRLECDCEKWRNSASFGTLKFQSGSEILSETSPASMNTWEPFAIDFNPADPQTNLYMDFRGSLGTTLPVPIARVQMFNATLTFEYSPLITVIEQAIPASVYQLGALIENETNDEGIQVLSLQMVTGETVTIDCDELEASRADGTSIRGALDFTGAQRDEWLRLASGNNTIRFTDTGTNDVDVVIRFRGRNTI